MVFGKTDKNGSHRNQLDHCRFINDLDLDHSKPLKLRIWLTLILVHAHAIHIRMYCTFIFTCLGLEVR